QQLATSSLQPIQNYSALGPISKMAKALVGGLMMKDAARGLQAGMGGSGGMSDEDVGNILGKDSPDFAAYVHANPLQKLDMQRRIVYPTIYNRQTNRPTQMYRDPQTGQWVQPPSKAEAAATRMNQVWNDPKSTQEQKLASK